MTGPINLLFSGDILAFVTLMAALILALSLHEYGHALAADVQGDMTARRAGRLSLNPVVHLDPIGTFLLVMAGIGWGKPVPFNPAALRNRRFGSAIVGIAGPAMNILLAVGAAFSLRWVASEFFARIIFQFLVVNVVLAVFNLIPVPPLDGSRLLSALLPPGRQHIVYALDRWGIFILLIVVFFFRGPLFFVINFVVSLIMGAIL